MDRYVILAVLWITWCFLHSFFTSRVFTDFIRTRSERLYRFSRIGFNIFAILSLTPVLVYSYAIQGPIIFKWEGAARGLQVVLLISSLVLFAGGARRYDLLQFLGLRRLQGQNTCAVLTGDCSLDTGGILSVVRHPWYAGGMLIIWVRDLSAASFISNLIIIGYFIIGAFLEEKKLVNQIGPTYRTYQQQVSMFFPLKWARRKLLAVTPD